MKYYILTPFFPSPISFRGSYLLDQAKAIQHLSGYSVKVIILSSFYSSSISSYTIENIECFTFKVFDFPSFLFPGWFKKWNLNRFNTFLIKNGIDCDSESIVHGHINYPSSDFLHYFKKKFHSITLLQHHGLDILQFDTGIKLPLIKFIQNKFLLKHFQLTNHYIDYHIAVSEKVKSELLQIDASLFQKTIVCINGVDTTKFYKKNIPVSSQYFTIGCVANFWKLKDQMTLLRAVNELQTNGFKNIKTIFIGDGPTLSDCKKYASNQNLFCEFIVEKKHSELVDFYNSIDLFVLPSYYEAFGCVYLESLACGTPFIAVKNQGVEDVIPPKLKEVQLVEKRNYIQLSEKMAFFYHNNFIVPFDKQYEIKNVISKMLHTISASSNE